MAAKEAKAITPVKREMREIVRKTTELVNPAPSAAASSRLSIRPQSALLRPGVCGGWWVGVGVGMWVYFCVHVCGCVCVRSCMCVRDPMGFFQVGTVALRCVCVRVCVRARVGC